MGILSVTASIVTCQRCEATILVKKWVDARKHGWTVPCDGLLQLCPLCTKYHEGVLSATAIPVSGYVPNTVKPPGRVSDGKGD